MKITWVKNGKSFVTFFLKRVIFLEKNEYNANLL